MLEIGISMIYCDADFFLDQYKPSENAENGHYVRGYNGDVISQNILSG
jgi:hypothetical protein